MKKELLFVTAAALFVFAASCTNNNPVTNNYTTVTPDNTTTYELQYGTQAYTGSDDCFITSGMPTTSLPSNTSNMVMNQTDTAKTLIQFDTSMIPADKVVTSCQLCLTIYPQLPTSNKVIDIYRLNSTWFGNTVTYNTEPSSVYHSSITVTPDSTLRCYSLQNLMPQEWITQPSSNHGIMLAIKDGTAPGTQFVISNEYSDVSQRPKLVITVR